MKAIIEKVEIILGSEAGERWGRPMQKITTSNGEYIDNNVGIKGSFWRAPDYSTMKGQEVEFTPVNDDNDDNDDNAKAGDRGYYQWIRLKEFN